MYSCHLYPLVCGTLPALLPVHCYYLEGLIASLKVVSGGGCVTVISRCNILEGTILFDSATREEGGSSDCNGLSIHYI